MWPWGAEEPRRGKGFIYSEELSDEDFSEIGLAQAETTLAETSHIEVDEDLYTNVVLSMLSPTDNCATKTFAVGLIILVACLQCVLAFAIYKNVEIAMSWTTNSVKAKSMHELYTDLLHKGRLSYIRLEQAEADDMCGEFQYDLEEKTLPGTKWTAYYHYTKVPVNSWHAWEIPPTERSILDDARYVLENEEYIYVYVIVTFMWNLSIINGLRLIFQLMFAIIQMPTARHKHERVLRQDQGEFQILAFTYSAKLMGLACVLYRIFISSVITWVGCQFLMWTCTNIELILNALALTFILELDRITYKAAISAARQNLISKLKKLRWHDPTRMTSRYLNFSKFVLQAVVLGSSGLLTWLLRRMQYLAYMDMFTLAASICLFQGPTPGYWTKFRSTFPVPGFCETVLDLRCEAPIVGEEGQPCVENWNQKLCKFYVQTDSLFSTWNSIDWKNQGACVRYVGDTPHAVSELDFTSHNPTHRYLAEACQMMWQQHPQVEFRNKQRDSTGPRLRVYPYKQFLPSAPIWCKYFDGSDRVLGEKAPTEIAAWKGLLESCKTTMLLYSVGRGNNMMTQGEVAMNEAGSSEATNITKATGPFSGVWLSPKLGVVFIENKGKTAKVTNALLPFSPMPCTVSGKTLTFMRDPFYTCKLEDDKIHVSNGDVLVNQKAQMQKERLRLANRRKHFSVPWFR